MKSTIKAVVPAMFIAIAGYGWIEGMSGWGWWLIGAPIAWMRIGDKSRVVVFAGHRYYPCGGMEDFQGTEASFEKAEQLVHRLDRKEGFNWAHALDSETGKVRDLSHVLRDLDDD